MAKAKDLQNADHKGFVVGPALGRAREKAGITQEAAAKEVGVHKMTLSEWERGVSRVPAEALLKLLPLYGITFTELQENGKAAKVSQNVNRGTSQRLGEPPSAYGDVVAFTTPRTTQEGRVWLEQFLLELARENADEDFLSWARRFLTNPQNFALYADGNRVEMTDEQKLRHMQGLAVGVRNILKDRQKKAKGK